MRYGPVHPVELASPRDRGDGTGRSLRRRTSLGSAPTSHGWTPSDDGAACAARPSCFLSGLATALLLLCSAAARADEPSEEARRFFDCTAGETGRAYVVGRTFLESQGKALLPLLREKARSVDHRQRDLARILLLKIGNPQRFEALQRGLWGSQTRLVLDDAGKARVVLSQQPDWYKARGSGRLPVPPDGLEYDRAAIPALLELLRATADSGSRESGRRRALQIMAHLADPDYAPTLVDSFYQQWNEDPLVEEALVKLGAAALPALRQALKDAPTEAPEGAASAGTRSVWRSMRRSCCVARTLARLNDRAGVPLLIDKLKATDDEDQQSAFAHALGRLGHPQAVPVLFDLMLGALRGGWGPGRYDEIEYGDARAALLDLGPLASEHLVEQSKPGQPLGRRVMARGLAFELTSPQAAARLYEATARTLPYETVRRYLPAAGGTYPPPSGVAAQPDITPEQYAAAGRARFWSGRQWRPFGGDLLSDATYQPATDLLVERVLKDARPEDLLRLGRLRTPPWGFDVFLEILDRPRARGRGEAVVRALAIWGDGRVVDVLCKLVSQPDKVRPEAIVEAALALGDEKAIEILEEIQSAAKSSPALSKAAKLAREVAPALRGDRKALVRLLEHPRPALRETAARLLLRRGDTAGVATLIAGLVQPGGGLYVRRRDDLVRQGKRVLGALKQHALKTPDPRQRVMCEAVALRITNPELAGRFERAIPYRSHAFGSRGGPRVGDYRITGQEIARRVGKGAIPLLEAEAVTPSGWGNSAVAGFALAVFKEKHSMDLLVGVLRDPKAEDRTRGLLAHAIRDFGQQGVAAIKDIPVPDPDRPEFGFRATRFRGATRALVSADPKAAAENVVKGLKALAADSARKDPGWVDRVRGFLRLAGQVEDPAMIEPILEVLELDRKHLEAYAFGPLSRFEDSRLTQPALEAVLRPGSSLSPGGTSALLTLMRQLKGRTAARLVKELRESDDAGRRACAIEALAGLIEDSAPWDAIYRAKPREADPREPESRQTSFTVGLEPLLAALDDPEPVVQVAAAKALPRIRRSLDLRADDRPVRLLLGWLPKAPEIPRETVEFLLWTRHGDVKPALLKAFRDRGGKDDAILSGFASGGWGWAEAVPAVYDSLKRVLKEESWHGPASARLRVLGRLGPEGRARLHEVIKDPQMPLGIRFDAAYELAGGHLVGRPFPTAYADVIALRDDVAAAGPDDPRLETIYLRNVRQDDAAARWRHVVEGLTLAAAKLDRRRGYPMLIKLFPTLDDGDYRQRVIRVIEQIGDDARERK